MMAEDLQKYIDLKKSINDRKIEISEMENDLFQLKMDVPLDKLISHYEYVVETTKKIYYENIGDPFKHMSYEKASFELTTLNEQKEAGLDFYNPSWKEG